MLKPDEIVKTVNFMNSVGALRVATGEVSREEYLAPKKVNQRQSIKKEELIRGLENLFSNVDGLRIDNLRTRDQIPGATYDVTFDNPGIFDPNCWVGCNYSSDARELIIMSKGFPLPKQIADYINSKFKNSEFTTVLGRFYTWKGILPEEILALGK